MSKQTIEIEDSLPDRVECAIDEVKNTLLDYLNDNPGTDSLPCLNNDLDYSGTIHEIVDGSVPIYTHDIKACWFLHDNELEEAYNNVGVGDNPRENDGMAAIYFYIMEKVQEWYQDEAQDIFDEWYRTTDQNGVKVESGQSVDVESDGDHVPNDFTGTVVSVDTEDGTAVVKDQEDDCFTVNCRGLTVNR